MDLGALINNRQLAIENQKRIGPDKTKEFIDILKENDKKDFVKRILNPAGYPIVKNEDGSYSTHRMGSAEVNGKYIVFPTLFHDVAKGQLYEAQNPVREALKRGDYITFYNPEDAETFADNGYKVGLGYNAPKIPNVDAIAALLAPDR